MIIEGCNTFSHLAAEIFDLERIGNDTSGPEWAPALRKGVNCLASRTIQNGAFYHSPEAFGRG